MREGQIQPVSKAPEGSIERRGSNRLRSDGILTHLSYFASTVYDLVAGVGGNGVIGKEGKPAIRNREDERRSPRLTDSGFTSEVTSLCLGHEALLTLPEWPMGSGSFRTDLYLAKSGGPAGSRRRICLGRK